MFRKWWDRHGPDSRWQAFRLVNEPPTGQYIPMQVRQLVGGKNWSVSLVKMRLGDRRVTDEGGSR